MMRAPTGQAMVRTFVKRHSLLLYLALAFAWFWGGLALNKIPLLRFWAPLGGALAPAVSAVFVAAIGQGETAVRELMRKLWRWRVGWRWYGAAFGIPMAQALLAAGIASSFGAFKLARINVEMLRASLPGLWVVFLFAAGEELGWRGFALPRLLSRHDAIVATVILGATHAVWHWPLILLPHMWMSDIPAIPWTVAVLAEAFVFTWIARGTGGSVLLVAFFHGMSNLVSMFYQGIEPRSMPWLRCGVAVLVTVMLLLAVGRGLGREPAPRPTTAAGE